LLHYYKTIEVGSSAGKQTQKKVTDREETAPIVD